MFDANFTFLCDPIDRSDSPKAMRVIDWWACDWPCKNQQCECIIIVDFPTLLYHNLQTIYTNTTKCLPLLQNLMGFLLQFTQVEYHIHS